MDLAEKERREPQRRLRGDERAGLGSLLGWEMQAQYGKDREREREGKGKGMFGIQGFLRHQALSVLVSEHVPRVEKEKEKGKEKEKDKEKEGEGEPPGSSSYVHPAKPYLFTICGRPEWRTLGYYRQSSRSADAGGDSYTLTLGEAVREWAEDVGHSCPKGCGMMKAEHEVRFVHGGVRVAVNVAERVRGFDVDETANGEVGKEKKRGGIVMWASCAVCGKRTKRSVVSDGTL